MAKLVYIGGYGRSGSTLLEYLLTAHPQLVACGEVARHLVSSGRKKTCTCGRPMQDCPVWGAFPHKKRTLKRFDHEHLDLGLLQHVSGRYAVMIDSSKTAWGTFSTPSKLNKKLGPDFVLVHLVRDPRAVSWSTMRMPWQPKMGRLAAAPLLRCLGTVAGWSAANLACEVFGRLHPDRYLRVRYEDLVNAPLKVIEAILSRVSLELPSIVEPSAAHGNRHQLYGNAIRYKKLSLSDLKEDVAWKTAMPKRYRGLIASLCWPLSRRYAYSGNANGAGASSR